MSRRSTPEQRAALAAWDRAVWAWEDRDCSERSEAYYSKCMVPWIEWANRLFDGGPYWGPAGTAEGR